MRYAVVRKGRVENVARWDGQTPWDLPPGCLAVPDPHGFAEPGGSWDGLLFARAAPRQDRTTSEAGLLAALDAARLAAALGDEPDLARIEAAKSAVREARR